MVTLANDTPYGVVYYFSGQHGTLINLPAQIITDLTGTGGLKPGGPIWLRPQVEWKDIEYVQTSPATYDFSIVDDLVSRCNAANIYICYCIQSPPQWKRTVDINGNSVAADGTTCNTTLATAITSPGLPTYSITVNALGTGQTLATGQQITIDYNSNTQSENVLVTNGPYSAGATTITVSNLVGGVWKPQNAHSAGVAVLNSGGLFANATDTKDYVKNWVSRYNNTTKNFITGANQTALTVQAVQWNEDFDTPGNNNQRDVQSCWAVPIYQSIGPLIRLRAPNMLIGAPAVRRTSKVSGYTNYGTSHIQAWIDNLFSYTPPGGTQGCASFLDFLDFHYYRDGESSADPNVPLPDSGGAAVPTPAQEIAAIRTKANQYGYGSIPIWCTETGWNVWDDGTGTVNRETFPQQAQYFQESLDQHREYGGSHIFFWTMDTQTRAQMYNNPNTATDIKSFVAVEYQSSRDPNPVYTRLNAWYTLQSYIAQYPTWGSATLKNLNARTTTKFQSRAKLQPTTRSTFSVNVEASMYTYKVSVYARSGSNIATTARSGIVQTTARGS